MAGPRRSCTAGSRSRWSASYNAASIFKRAEGSGHITHIDGLDQLMAEYGDSVATLELLPVGAHRRDWRATLISDGMVDRPPSRARTR